MKAIKELYHDRQNYKWYDYPAINRVQEDSRLGARFKVYHADNTYSYGYMYGERQFTYDYNELMSVRKNDKAKHAINKIRNELINRIKELDVETLYKITKEYC